MFKSYKKGSHISRSKFREILRYFSADINASTTSQLTKIGRKTINNIYLEIRKCIADYCENESCFSKGEIELDESYFGARRVKGIRGRGAKGKIPVFGVLKRGDKVYTQIVNSCFCHVIPN